MDSEQHEGYDFTWDAVKAERSRAKHGVAFDEAMTVFDDPLAAVFEDILHSSEEPRNYLIGLSNSRRLLAICYVERDGVIRLISARPATAKERRGYENERNR